MSYSVINQDGVHLCDIPLNVYQVIRRQSLSALWLYWAQSLNLVKVLIACVGKMIFVMPVMWFWVLVVCRLVEPERISDVPGLISPDVIGWPLVRPSPSLSIPFLHAQLCTDTTTFSSSIFAQE